MDWFFITSGPNRIEFEYVLDLLSRFDVDDIVDYIIHCNYYVLHVS